MPKNKMPRVYIDACYYIDVAQGRHAVNVDPARLSHLPYLEGMLLASGDGVIEVWASTLIIAECLYVDGQLDTVPEAVRQTFQSLLTSGSFVKLQAVDFFIAERSRDLRWVDEVRGLRGADAIHVATALELGCDEFITSNRSKGPLQGDTPKKLNDLGLRVIQAPDTQVLSNDYLPPPLFHGV